MNMLLRPAPDLSIELLHKGLNVKPLADALDRQPELWNVHDARTVAPDSPHREVDDIWCRFAPEGSGGGIPHFSIWYPAADCLPMRRIARDIMYLSAGEALGGILITRIPAGKQCYPHLDDSWHAKFFAKYALQVKAAPGQAFHFEDRSLVTEPGDLYTFRNQRTHWVTNHSDQERITCFFCIRLDQ